MTASSIKIGIFELGENLHTALQHVKKQNSKGFENWKVETKLLKLLDRIIGYCL